MKGAIAWFADNHVAANLLMFFLLIAGIITAFSIKLEVFPETTLDKINITTAYPGASPEEVEEGVVRRIEENIAGLTGIERIDSKAREGSGSVTIEVMKDWDLKKLLDEVKAEVDRITTLPDEAEKPVVRELTRQSQVVSISVYGDVSEASIKHVAETIKDELTNLPGITLAEVAAGRDSEIHIEISENTLRKYGLTLGMVAAAVEKNSLDLPAGSVKTRTGEVLIRTKGRRYYAPDYHDIPIITNPDGTNVTLDDIADLKEGFADVDLYAGFDGKPALIINVYRVAEQNALKVASAVKEYLAEITPGLPDGISVGIYNDWSKILKSRIELLTKNMFWGLLLVSLILGFFLNLRLAFWVTLGIPISFSAGLILLPYNDVSLNMISLFAFIMVLGIVVDDAIIVGENVFRKQEEGLPPLAAAVEGAIEVGRPVIFSVLTTMVAFGPLLMAGGTMGKFMRNIPIVVIAVLFGSLVESLFVLPAHLARSKAALMVQSPEYKEKFMARIMSWVIQKPYAWLVKFCVRWRYMTVAIGIAVLMLTIGVWASGKIKFTFFPKVEGDVLQCMVTMPSGTPLARTRELVKYIEQAGKDVMTEQDKKRPENAQPLMEYSANLIGAQFGRHGTSGSGGHLAQVWIQLLDGEIRDISSAELNRLWRERVGSIADAESLIFSSEIHSAGNAIEIHLSINDYEQLQVAADDLKTELDKFPGVFDISDSYLPGKMEMQLKLKPNAKSLGLTLNDLARQVRHGFYGAEAIRFQRDKNEVKVLVRFPDAERKSVGNVEEMRIRTASGDEVPFRTVAEVDMKRGYSTIERAQRLRVIKVTADVNEKQANANEIRQDLVDRFLPDLKNKYPGLRFTIEGEGKEQQESLADVKRGFIIALFCIYALLAVPFKSFSQPLIVMSAIPFGIVGAVWGHLLMGFNISIISLFGIVGLSGVVVNDSLVLIHRVNRMRREGDSAFEAVIKGGMFRFRAIILTSLTTFAGLTPMLLEKSIQARFLIPMAVSLGFGVIFATGITLLLIPCGYMILDDIHALIEKIKQLFRSSTVQPDIRD
ncbi:MAG: efflux RND transporter permease subunit [Desulfobacteraceae bacterium]|nr:efflux RND transporter permease subunit [Desulfobacteraceae bacterium]MBC2757884.1 efflux RND transporter permease subunit [Desulfobacteraceae bacterium]